MGGTRVRGLRDEPMSEKHYALFMSSLSARSRELFLWIDPFRKYNVCAILYTEIDRNSYVLIRRRGRRGITKSLHVLPVAHWLRVLFAGR